MWRPGVSTHHLKTDIGHDANFLITGSTGGCHNDNLQCCQWWQSRHHDHLQVSLEFCGARMLNPHALKTKSSWWQLCFHWWCQRVSIIITTSGATSYVKVVIMTALGFSVVLCCTLTYHRADSRFAPSQWETALLCNDVFHWLGASLESALYKHWFRWQMETKLSTVQYLSQYWPSSILIQCACVCTYFHVSYFCRCGSYVCFINRLLFYQDQVILLCKHQMKCDRTSRIINVFKRRIIYCGVLQWVHYWATDESNYLVKCFFKYIICIYIYMNEMSQYEFIITFKIRWKFQFQMFLPRF